MPDPVPGSQYSSQGTTVSFDGTALGRLTSFDSSAQAGQLADVTSAASRLIGTGPGTRVVSSYDCTLIEPPVLTLGIFGPPSFTPDDVGRIATLAFSAPGNTKSGLAVLTGISHRGQAGQYSEGTATFQWIG